MQGSDSTQSIFRRYYADEGFIDRYLVEPDAGTDVIIPVIHSNELWEANLRSIYREIPVNRMLIGDGGCIDDTIDIVRRFPRVVVLDHRHIKSLGYSERLLIEAVETEWFAHLHSDVYLPDGWFDIMRKYQAEFDWFGCTERGTIMVEYDRDFRDRPWAGGQLARTRIFDVGLKEIEDDYIYRHGDFVYRQMVERGGFREGRVTETFHYHQTMHRPSRWARKVTAVKVDVQLSPEEKVRQATMEFKGTVKYLDPSIPWAVQEVQGSVIELLDLGAMTWREIRSYVRETNRSWLPYVSRSLLLRRHAHELVRTTYRALFKYW